VHGIICGRLAKGLTNASEEDFRDDVREYFGMGTQLQELYLTPESLNPTNWDDLAEAAKWSRANADVLVDTHWIGGNPRQGEIYGWASWSPRKAILVLRNPDDKSAVFTADVQKLFELPAGAAQTFRLGSPWNEDRKEPEISVRAGELHAFKLEPFQVMVLESK
jgi:hypothetical protein